MGHGAFEEFPISKLVPDHSLERGKVGAHHGEAMSASIAS
jgi:hypothetical protein